MKLYPFQREGVRFLEEADGRAILGDDMGLGKTPQSLRWLRRTHHASPVVIVVPAAIKLKWVEEIHTWLSPRSRPYVLSGKKPRSLKHLKRKIFIVNYEILANKRVKPEGSRRSIAIKNTGWIDFLLELKPKTIIIDEAQRIKNPRTNQTKDVKRLCRKAEHVIPLTGTPMETCPRELYTLLEITRPGMFGWYSFMSRYCGPKHNGWAMTYDGATNMEELHEKLKTVMIRRLKRNVEKQMPKKIRIVIPIEMENDEEYFEAEALFTTWIRARKKIDHKEAKNKITELNKMAWKQKRKDCFSWIHDFLECGEKLIVYAWNKVVISALMREFQGQALRLDGSVTGNRREKVVACFMKDPAWPLLIANYGVVPGLNLYSAATTAWVQLPWSHAKLDQADDRVDRIGQLAATVRHYYLVAANTNEEDLLPLIDQRRKIAAAVLDGETPLKTTLLSDLLEKYLR